ncbi:2,3-bisphosphoglycerate-independent phosphoglycerate mutase, partial [Candidatus Auribacterota bacterium]
MKKKPLLLIIRDGWGVSDLEHGNATRSAKTPVLNDLLANYPNCVLQASGEAVGLPEGQMGNSEVGHLNIGAGRTVYQEFTRITKAVQTGEIFKNKVLIDAIDNAVRNDSALYLSGLVSDGGVHSHNEHIYALLELAKRKGLTRVYVHAILDGRDTSPTGGAGYVAELEGKMREIGVGRIAVVTGRYYAMDRDNRWERVEKGYRAFVYGEGKKSKSAVEAIKGSYKEGITDEFVLPVVIENDDGTPVASVKAADSFIFFNFRADRAREITRTFIDKSFDKFDRPEGLFPHYVCLTEYDAEFDAPVAFPPQSLNNILGEVLSNNGLNQLRIAETEKYAHVTFFFNGGVEVPFKNEDRCLVPSPKVATYDMKPEMSAYEVTGELIKKIKSGKYDVIIANYANPDMVGHTGKIPAVTKALEAVDECVGKAVRAVKETGGTVLVTADHGNSDMMIDRKTGEEFTAHT